MCMCVLMNVGVKNVCRYECMPACMCVYLFLYINVHVYGYGYGPGYADGSVSRYRHIHTYTQVHLPGRLAHIGHSWLRLPADGMCVTVVMVLM